MREAKRVHSTTRLNAPADPTRRHFVTQAAGVAAGGTVLALAAAAPAGFPDPVYDLIEAHRTAYAAYLPA